MLFSQLLHLYSQKTHGTHAVRFQVTPSNIFVVYPSIVSEITGLGFSFQCLGLIPWSVGGLFKKKGQEKDMTNVSLDDDVR